MIWALLACVGPEADSGLEPVPTAAYEGEVRIAEVTVACEGLRVARLSTEGVADGAVLRFPSLEEAHPMRLESVDDGGWWSLWSVSLAEGEYTPGSVTTAVCTDPLPWVAELSLDGEVVDSCEETSC